MELKDRINAVIRTPKYKKAFERYSQIVKPESRSGMWMSGSEIFIHPLSQEANNLCVAFKIPYPFHPNSIVPDGFPAVIPIASRIEEGKYRGKNFVGPGTDYCVHVKIDVTQPITKIQNEIKAMYERFNKGGDIKRRSRNRTNKKIEGGIWEVYDQVTLGKLTPYQVAKKFGMQRKPADDKKADKIYRRVLDAYTKAREMVADVQEGHI